MNAFSFIKLFGGLAFFLYGMNLLSESLEKMAGGKLEKMLKKMTDNPWKGLLAGTIITIAIQSSSAMTVMLVGFVNSGIMELPQTVGVIFGADVGTTLTAWILSLTGINNASGNFILEFIKPENFSLVMAVIGILLLMIAKDHRKKDVGSMMIGFCILMTGMSMMSDSMAPLADMPQFAEMMTAFNNPILGVLVGTLITGVIQSSAASIGILQGLSMTGQISLGMAIPIIMGANIGTCMTAILSSIGVERKAKRVSAVHGSIKIVGTILWLVVFYGLNAIFHFAFLTLPANTFNIALYHSIFNVVNTIILFPFQKQFVRLAYFIFPDDVEEKELFLDDRIMATPTIALAEVQNSMMKMVKKTKNGLDTATDLILKGYDEKEFEWIRKNEAKIDHYEDNIGAYTMKLTTTQHLSQEDKKLATRILQGIGEFERLADHAGYLADSAQEMAEKSLAFSPAGKEEVIRLVHACQEVYHLAVECYRSGDVADASKIEPLRSVIRLMCDTYNEAHIERLASGECQAVQGFIFKDILYSCERIADHSQNIAAIVLRVSHLNADSALYMHDLKQGKTEENRRMYEEYYEKYLSA